MTLSITRGERGGFNEAVDKEEKENERKNIDRIDVALLPHGMRGNGTYRGKGEDLWERDSGDHPVFCFPKALSGRHLEGLPEGF